MQWGAEADAKLFMHVLKIHNVKIDYAALAMAMGNDVTPKALTHRIAKLRSMADDASTSTSTSGASSGLSLPQPNKRTATKSRASRSMTPGPSVAAAAARKKAAAIEDNNNNDDDDENENEKPVSGVGGVGGIKRTATGAVKGADGGKGMAMKKKTSPLKSVAAAGNGKDDDDGAGEMEEDVKKEIMNKKVKIGGAGVGVDGEANDGKEYA